MNTSVRFLLPRSRRPSRAGAFAALAAFVIAGATGAWAQTAGTPQAYPAAALAFVDAELPQMEAAVAARDRDYFEEAMGRTISFSERWGFKTSANPALAPYAACTEAVNGFAIVGLCRLMPQADDCLPGLAQQLQSQLQRCRAIAAAP